MSNLILVIAFGYVLGEMGKQLAASIHADIFKFLHRKEIAKAKKEQEEAANKIRMQLGAMISGAPVEPEETKEELQ